jgi:hypothetical protein
MGVVSINDPIAKVIVLVSFFLIVVAIVWLSMRSTLKKRGAAERFARQHYENRGFSVEASGMSHEWFVDAKGQVEGHTVIIRWADHTTLRSSPLEPWTEISVVPPSLPAEFGLEVGRAGVQATNADYPLATGDPGFDASFVGWTNYPQLAPFLLTAQVRHGLLALGDLPKLKLSVLTTNYERPRPHRPTPSVTILTRTRIFDVAKLDQITSVGIDLCESMAQVFDASRQPMPSR